VHDFAAPAPAQIPEPTPNLPRPAERPTSWSNTQVFSAMQRATCWS